MEFEIRRQSRRTTMGPAAKGAGSRRRHRPAVAGESAHAWIAPFVLAGAANRSRQTHAGQLRCGQRQSRQLADADWFVCIELCGAVGDRELDAHSTEGGSDGLRPGTLTSFHTKPVASIDRAIYAAISPLRPTFIHPDTLDRG